MLSSFRMPAVVVEVSNLRASVICWNFLFDEYNSPKGRWLTGYNKFPLKRMNNSNQLKIEQKKAEDFQATIIKERNSKFPLTFFNFWNLVESKHLIVIRVGGERTSLCWDPEQSWSTSQALSWAAGCDVSADTKTTSWPQIALPNAWRQEIYDQNNKRWAQE